MRTDLKVFFRANTSIFFCISVYVYANQNQIRKISKCLNASEPIN